MANISINIPKAGKSAVVAVDTDSFSEDTFKAIFAEGLKACLNSRMTKVGAVTKLEGADLAKAQALALDIANKNLSDLQAGKFKFAGQAKAKSADKREVINEAMRLARDFVRDQIKAANFKISHIPAKQITEAAKALVDTKPEYLDKARANLAARETAPTVTLDLASLGIDVAEAEHRSEELKAKRSAAAKANLSAAQAGRTTKVAGRATKAKPASGKPDLGAILGTGATAQGNAPAPLH